MAKIGVAKLKDQIAILSPTPVAKAVTSITRVLQVATVTTPVAHGYATGDFVTHAGAVQPEYNVEAAVTVTSPTVYTFAVSGTPATPATGTITSLWVSDPQGGGGSGVFTLASGVAAYIEPLTAGEQLAMGGIAAVGFYKVVIYYRADITPAMKIQWRKYQETAAKTYEIHSVQPLEGDGRRMLQLEIGISE